MEHIIQNINPTVSASDYSKLSELMIAATDGYISIEAENNLIKSLHLDGSDIRELDIIMDFLSYKKMN